MIEKDDEILNKNFLFNLQSTNNINDYLNVISEYYNILEKGIIISRKNYSELFALSLR